MLLKGIKKILSNAATNAIGQNTYGYILDTYPNGTYVNGCALFDAKVLVAMPYGETKIFTDNIGKQLNSYYPGVYVSLKVHKNDINILEVANAERIPYDIKNLLISDAENMGINKDLNKSIETNSSASDTIFVDGVEYVKKDILEARKETRKSPFDE